MRNLQYKQFESNLQNDRSEDQQKEIVNIYNTSSTQWCEAAGQTFIFMNYLFTHDHLKSTKNDYYALQAAYPDSVVQAHVCGKIKQTKCEYLELSFSLAPPRFYSKPRKPKWEELQCKYTAAGKSWLIVDESKQER